jgi:hypothetical protein
LTDWDDDTEGEMKSEPLFCLACPTGREMKKVLLGLMVAVSVGMAAPAFAQEEAAEPTDKVVQEADVTKFKKKTVIDFSDVTIQGELTKPEGSYLLNRKKTNFRSLLKTRTNFLPELFNSTDNL